MSEHFGRTADGTPVERHVLSAPGIRASVLTYGCVVQSLDVPDSRGRPGNVVLGLDTMDGYLTRSRFFGAVVGRYGNRIADGRFTLEGRAYELPRNNGSNSLHGGPEGFDKRVWRPAGTAGDRISLAYRSADGEAGYPGTLDATVTYTVAGTGEGPEGEWSLRIDYRAVTDAPTHVNLTNHSYFNLAGAGPGPTGGPGTVHDHEVTLRASRYLPVDDRLIPTGELAPVAGTPFDFTAPRRIGDRLDDGHPQLKTAGGYDHCWVFDEPAGPLRPVARVTEPGSGRAMEVLTTEPGVQFYSGNMLTDAVYGRGTGLCLETEHFPDSPNRPEFPSTVLRPGEAYSSTTVYRFTAGAPAGDR